MNETSNSLNTLGEALAAILKPIVKEAVREAMGQNGHGKGSLLKPEELAVSLNVPASWVYEQTRQGNIPAHRLGRYVRFDLHEVLASLKKD